MAERAIFLDRDNTIIEDEGYLGDPAKVKLLPGAATAIAAMRRLGYRIIIVSNQSGVVRGMFTEADVEAVNQEMCKQLREQAGAHIDASYYCPYHPEGVLPEYKMEHEWRKPKPGMLKQAAEDFALDLAQSWMIGDMGRDIAAGMAAGCRTILLKDPEHPAKEAGPEESPNFMVKSLADAARIVAREGRNPHPELVMPTTAATVSVTGNMAEDGTAATEAALPPAIDEQALADKLARRIERNMPKPEVLRPVLEEIREQLRMEAREKEIPEFSLARMLAMLVQILVVACVLGAVWTAMGTGREGWDGAGWAHSVIILMRAALWMMAAIVLQGFVIALHAGARRGD